MKAATIALVLALTVGPCAAAADRHAPTFWERVFAPSKATPKKKSAPKHHRKAAAKLKPKQRARADEPTSDKTFVVDHEWMAHYWILAGEWDYQIPEEREIRYVDGKYIVPAVVFRHLQDMMEGKQIEAKGPKGHKP